MFQKLLAVGIVTFAVIAPVSIAMSQDNPLCYMESDKKGTLDLSQICGKTPVNDAQPAQTQSQDGSQGSDGNQPPAPSQPIDPSVQLVPGQKMEPPVKLRKEASPLWNLVPDLPQPPQEKPAAGK